MGKVTKKQHYVPQFLLRGFCIRPNGNDQIHIFDMHKTQNRGPQNIKDCFMQNYFYDTDNTIENFLGKHIEGPASKLICQIREDREIPSSDPNNNLIKFFSSQLSRTVESKNENFRFVDAHIKEMLSDITSDYSPKINLDDFKLRPKGKDGERDFISERTMHGILVSKGLEDLKFHLLKNKTDCEFIISDHPVTKYNWLYKNSGHHQIASLMARGLQLYLPISHDLCLCAYDPSSYKLGIKKSSSSDIKNIKDVNWLNELQIRSSNSIVGYKSLKMKSYIEKKSKPLFGNKIYSTHSKQIDVETQSCETESPRVIIYSKQANLEVKPDFYKVIKKAKEKSNIYEDRNFEISKNIYKLIELAKEKQSTKPHKYTP